eukprot:SAG25_NODE_126_length_14581_cov_5.819569_6_plen_158_part_00
MSPSHAQVSIHVKLSMHISASRRRAFSCAQRSPSATGCCPALAASVGRVRFRLHIVHVRACCRYAADMLIRIGHVRVHAYLRHGLSLLLLRKKYNIYKIQHVNGCSVGEITRLQASACHLATSRARVSIATVLTQHVRQPRLPLLQATLRGTPTRNR